MSVEALSKIEEAKANIGMGSRMRLPGVDPSPNVEDKRTSAVTNTLNTLISREPTIGYMGRKPIHSQFDPDVRQSQTARDLGYWDITQATDEYRARPERRYPGGIIQIGAGGFHSPNRAAKGDYAPNPEPK